MKRVLKLILGINILLAVLSVFSYISPYVDPASNWFFSAVAIFNPWYLLGHILFIIFWLFFKYKYALLPFIIIILGWNHLVGIFNFNLGQTNQDGIAVMSFNFQNSNYIQVKDPKVKAEKVKAYESFLNSLNPIDILCAYEMSYRSKQLIKKVYGFEHEAVYEHKSVGIFSNYPVIDKGLIDFGNRSNNCLWADLDVEGDIIRIYAVHFESSQVSIATEKVLDSGDIQERATWKSIQQIFGKYGHHAGNRSFQGTQIIAHKLKSPHPVIICGDFNETPQSYLYRQLRKDMQDTFREKGSGYGATYAGSIPGLRIDYILTDHDFEISSHEIIREKYSDHFPIVSTIKLKK